MVVDGHLVVAHVGKPGDDVAAPVEPGAAGCVADREVHLATGQMQILGDLRAGLSGADDQDFALGQLGGVAVLVRVDLRDRAGSFSAMRGMIGMW